MFNNKLPQVCLTGTRSPGLSSGCTQPVMGGSGCICLPTSHRIGQSGEVPGLPLKEDHSDCPRVAQQALVLGSSDHVQPDPSEPAQPDKTVNTALQSDPSQESGKPKSPYMAPRASVIKGQGSTN